MVFAYKLGQHYLIIFQRKHARYKYGKVADDRRPDNRNPLYLWDVPKLVIQQRQDSYKYPHTRLPRRYKRHLFFGWLVANHHFYNSLFWLYSKRKLIHNKLHRNGYY